MKPANCRSQKDNLHVYSYHSCALCLHASARKPLADICGKPMIVRVMEQAKRSGAARVIVATDTQAVFDAVIAEGGEACMTREDHQSRTERLAEVIDHYRFADDEIIVNVQGDEPLIPDSIIAQVAENLAASEAGMATLAVKITSAEEAFNPNAVKVVMDKQGYALYFSQGHHSVGSRAFHAQP